MDAAYLPERIVSRGGRAPALTLRPPASSGTSLRSPRVEKISVQRSDGGITNNVEPILPGSQDFARGAADYDFGASVLGSCRRLGRNGFVGSAFIRGCFRRCGLQGSLFGGGTLNCSCLRPIFIGALLCRGG